ncbi:MAG: methyltransferase domain-containing protein [Nitrospinae bacterium]|nr:methyltransferase domain-containing protein [Nitrospinota bacterium]MBL7020903.1 methyltransferase domain-containing protein [Nitrospinaceae bacterium]
MKKAPIIIAEDSPFLTTETRQTRWAIPYNFECLNARIDNLLTRNQNCIKGKRVLDIGSHMGTFMYSALILGAEYVQGIDTEEKTIERGQELFQQLKVAESRYNLQVDDAFRYLENLEEGSFDTVLCLGTLYYMVEPYRLLKLMQKVAKETVLIDTFTAAYAAIQGKEAPDVYRAINEESLKLPMLLTALTQPGKKDYRLPHSFPHRDKDLSLITLPTDALLKIWFQSLEMSCTEINWKEYQTRPCTYHDLLTPDQKKSSHWADVYTSGVRASYLLRAAPGSRDILP